MRADLYPDGVLEKCETLKESALWALEPKIRPRAWLDNFKGDADRLLASVLLDNLLLYSDRASDCLLLAAFDRLEDDALLGRLALPSPSDFLANVVLTPIEGENPRPTDSGKTVCRRLRDLAEIDDKRFLEPRDALELARAGRPVLFVDDFIGSGQQLIQTWNRPYRSDAPRSFADAHAASAFPAFALALVVTEQAIRNIALKGIPVVIRATHALDGSYSVQQLEAPTLSPPIAQFQVALRELLERHRGRLTVPPFLKQDAALFGFHELGLLLGFGHGVPDSTLPLVWADGDQGWVPLVR